MSSFDVATVAEHVAEAYDEAVAACERGLQQDTARKVGNAKPGETIRLNDRIEDAEISATVSAAIGQAREKAMDAITRGLDRAQKKLTDAPTAEAANYIVAISQRDDMTADEIAAALDRYKGHAAQHAIRAAAKRSGVTQYVGQTDAEREVEAYRALAGAVGQYFTIFAIEGGAGVRNKLTRETFLTIGRGADPSSVDTMNEIFGGR